MRNSESRSAELVEAGGRKAGVDVESRMREAGGQSAEQVEAGG